MLAGDGKLQQFPCGLVFLFIKYFYYNIEEEEREYSEGENESGNDKKI